MEKIGAIKTAGVFVPAVILTALLAVSSEAHGFQGSIPIRKGQKAQWHKMAALSIFKAIEIALSRFKGTPVEVELGARDGFLVYEVELSTGGDAVTEAVIDAGNGNILKSEQEDEEDEAEDHDNGEEENNPLEKTKISLSDAIKAALTAKPGTPVEAELEHENGHLSYSVEIVDADGKTFKVKVDAGAGKVQKIKNG